MQQEKQHIIQLLISQVIRINEKYEEIKKIKGENFNIFSILKLERYEVQTHSNFIYELLNYEGSHNQGTLFLELFLNKVLKLEDYGNIKNVYQEHATNDNRRIDFVIETQNYQIGIEMKIDAGDQINQLFDYKKELDKAGKESKLYYLTLTGYEASEKSTNATLQVHKDYFLISFKDDIYDWLEACIEKSATTPLLREGLVHYKNLIGKITNKISIPMEAEMKELIKTPKQIEAAQIILNEYPKIWAKKEMEFWYQLNEHLHGFYEENGYELRDEFGIWFNEQENEMSIDDVIAKIQSQRNLKNFPVGLALEKEHENSSSTYLSICEWSDKIYLYISFWDKHGQSCINSSLETICKNIGFYGVEKGIRYKIIDEKITFYGRYQIEPTFDLFDDSRFQKYLETVAKEIQNTINILNKNEKSITNAITS